MAADRPGTRWQDRVSVVAAIVTAGVLAVVVGLVVSWGAPLVRESVRLLRQGTSTHQPAEPVPTATAGRPSPIVTLAPVSEAQLRAALPTARQLGGKFRASARMDRTALGLIWGPGLPTCNWRGVKVPGRIIERSAHMSRMGSPNQDAYYAGGVVYPSQRAAQAAMGTLIASARRCPPRWHQGQIDASRWRPHWVLRAFDGRWQYSMHRSADRWRQLRAIEYATYPPMRGQTRDVSRRIIDYAQRGNVVVTQVLKMWGKPGEPITGMQQMSTRLLASMTSRLSGICQSEHATGCGGTG